MNARRITLAAAAALSALAVAPASAPATIIAAPGAVSFPERQVGTQSDPGSVTVTVLCTVPGQGVCLANDTYVPSAAIVGANAADFSVQNLTCGNGITNNGLAPQSCSLQVRFNPTAAGARSATLIPGQGTSSNPTPVALSGSAVAAPAQTTPAKKKCKKKKKGKKAAPAAKKCKKKKKKK